MIDRLPSADSRPPLRLAAANDLRRDPAAPQPSKKRRSAPTIPSSSALSATTTFNGRGDRTAYLQEVREAAVQVRAVSQRLAREPSGIAMIAFGEVSVDLERRQVARKDQPAHIMPIEFRLLATPITTPGKVLTHRQLLREVWGPATRYAATIALFHKLWNS